MTIYVVIYIDNGYEAFGRNWVGVKKTKNKRRERRSVVAVG